MGVSIAPGVNPVPAKIDDGVVTYYVGDQEFTFVVDALKGKSFPLQCNMYKNRNIHAYFVGNGEAVVLRFSGTGCISICETGILLKNFVYKTNIPLVQHAQGGIIWRTDRGIEVKNALVDAYLLSTYDVFIMTSGVLPFSASCCVKECVPYIADLRLQLALGYPVLCIEDTKLIAKDLSLGTTRYEIPTKHLQCNKGFIIL